MERIPFTCTLDCGSRCELVACLQEQGDGVRRLVRLDTPPGRPDTVDRPRLVPCARGRAYRRLLDVPERVRTPLRRIGPRGSGEFVPVGWDEALDEVAARLEDVRVRWGAEAVLLGGGAGSMAGRGFTGADAARRFFSFWGPVSATAGNASFHCSAIAAEWMLGALLSGSDRATLLDAALIILWGMNPAELRMGPNTEYFIAEARERAGRGARVVLIDPRYTDSAVLADQWIPIRPGTDAALAAALAFVLETEGLVDPFLAGHTVGYEAYRAYLLGEADGITKTPQWAERITGVPADVIRALAREYGTRKPAALLAGWGPQRSRYGEQIARAWITLACMTGNVGISGGGLASVGTREDPFPVGELPYGPYPWGRHVSSATWAQAILAGELQPPLKLAYIVASNLICRSPDTHTNARALAQLDYVVVHEPFLTPTARHADMVLPVCTDLEHADLSTSWGHDAHLFYSRQVAPPLREARSDYWICARLAERLGFGAQYTQGRNEEEWVRHFLSADNLDTQALQEDGLMRTEGRPRVELAEFRADPIAHPLRTPSGRIEIVSPQAAAYGLPSVPSYVPDEDEGVAKGYPLQLITPHSRLRSNSCLYANPWLRALEVHAVWINPRDAAARGLQHGELAEVSSPFGTVALPAKVTERIMPGVVCIYQGTWSEPDAGDADGVAGVDRGGCANTLTSHRTSPSGGYATHSTWVEVRRATP